MQQWHWCSIRMAQMLGLRSLTRAWRAYEAALSQRPVATQMCTTTALWYAVLL